MGYQWRRFDRRNMRRRLRSRMESLNIHEAEKYANLVFSDRMERQVLDSMLRLTITRFFRNAWLWTELGALITQTGENLVTGDLLRIWSVGCAGGEEPFSLVMLLDELEKSGRLDQPWSILGTDTDPASLNRTQAAPYKWGSVREIPAHLLDRWFTEKDGLWTLDQEIREFVAFKHHDIGSMEPTGRFHLVFLRNSILTYNTEEIQRKILDRIHHCLLEPGYLVIGRTEKLPDGSQFKEASRCILKAT